MSFKDDIPHYKSMQDNDYYYNSLPNGFWSELPQFILGYCNEDEEGCGDMLRGMSVITRVSEPIYINGIGMEDFVSAIRRKCENHKFDLIFDCLALIITHTSCMPEKLNEFLEEHKIGYRCTFNYKYVVWEAIDENEVLIMIDDLQEKVKPISEDCFEKLSNLKNNLNDYKDEKSRKEALRNAISAVEGLIKNITHEKEFNSAVENLIDNKVGDKTILRYGKTLWQYVHDKKPDCRHGVQDNEKARLSIDDATFWINQITNYAHYIVDINR